MFKIEDGREYFYQWDLDRRLIIEDNSITQVHFCNRTDDCSLVCEVYIEDSKRKVNVPNILLQDTWSINVYAYDSNYTKHSEQFKVKKRSKPADYIYTETEVFNYEQIKEQLDTIIEQGVSEEQLATGINNYFEKNPLTAEDVGALPDTTEIPSIEGLATEDYVMTVVGNLDIPDPDLSDYAKKEDIPSLEGYAKTEDIPDVSEFQTEAQVIALITEYGGGSGEALPASEEGAF